MRLEKGRGNAEEMKLVKHFLFMLFVVAGLALSVSAQKDDKKDRPPKNPPTVDPGKKNPPPPPKDDKRPKKPGMAYFLVVDGRIYEAG
jgi:hypothetical protein